MPHLCIFMYSLLVGVFVNRIEQSGGFFLLNCLTLLSLAIKYIYFVVDLDLERVIPLIRFFYFSDSCQQCPEEKYLKVNLDNFFAFMIKSKLSKKIK